jgi:sterol desaturase/sphingolipid hydroxylase (fatty acid hydroxylase superfamily)
VNRPAKPQCTNLLLLETGREDIRVHGKAQFRRAFDPGARPREVTGLSARGMVYVGCKALLEEHVEWWHEPALASACFALFMRIFQSADEDRPHGSSVFKPPFTWTWRGFAALAWYWAGIALWVSVVPQPTGVVGGCPESITDAGAWVRVVAELVSGIVAYDAIFFIIHLSMHAFPFLHSSTSHAQHHVSPCDETVYRTVNHSLLDGTLQVLTNIFVQRRSPVNYLCPTLFGDAKTRLARWLHNIVVVELLVESHARASHPLRLSRLCFDGVSKHYLHHRSGGPPFQQFFGYLDRALLSWQGGRCRSAGGSCTGKTAEARSS